MDEITKEKAYQIRNWSANFETSESRKRISNLQWVALPTRHDGRRFRRLSRHEQATEIFGAWCLIVEVAAKMPQRGKLIDDRDEPLKAVDLTDLTGFPEASFQMALKVLSSNEIGWLETIDWPESAGACCDLPEPAGQHLRHNPTQPDHTQPNNTKQNITEPNPTPKGNGLVKNSLSGMAGAGPLAGAVSRITRKIDRGDLEKQCAVQAKLSACGITGDVCRELYNRQDITVELIDRELKKIQTDSTIDDPAAILVHRLRQHGKPRKKSR